MNRRVRSLNNCPQISGPVVYWMSRDQRVNDNWALLYAQMQAIEMKQPMIAVFCKSPGFLGASVFHYHFMLQGLSHVEQELQAYRIPLCIVEGDPVEQIIHFVTQTAAGQLVTDFSPLKIARTWRKGVARGIGIRLSEVDAHNIVPCFRASDKQEFSAYTFRRKYYRQFNEWMTDFPEVLQHPFPPGNELKERLKLLNSPLREIRENGYDKAIQSGETAAFEKLEDFLMHRLLKYHLRNDPNEDVCSSLSPYLHFGQISAQRIADRIFKGNLAGADFLEELIIRRELADNFCYYNQNYDNPGGFPAWARQTLEAHQSDLRSYLYPLEKLENAATHDRLWNAAQQQMVKTGRIHGYLRMYWAKKILEWSENATAAMEKAIYLNDKYSLDGGDPNGYTGIAWSIGGVHDRAWGERNIFGKVRYMSYEGCKRKFDIEKYIHSVES